MKDPRAIPTLLVFTLGPPCESRRRPLLPRRLQQAEIGLRRACLETTLEAGREAGCRLMVSAPGPLDLPPEVERVPQAGKGFGERLAGAVALASRRSEGPVLVVGTDVPGLTAGHLRQALALLLEDPGRVVLGPSPDGGIYLLAAARPLDALLPGIRWCCAQTLASLRSALAAAEIQVTLLPLLADLDRPADLAAWLAQKREARDVWWALLGQLDELLALLRRPLLPRVAGSPTGGAIPVLSGRSPPRLPHPN